MNRLKYFICAIAILFFNFSFGQSTREMKLPLQLVTGYGPFEVGKGIVTFSPPPLEHPLYKSWTALEFKDIPPTLKSVEKGIIWIDFLQFLYQNTQAGNLPTHFYNQFKEESQITTAENSLSRKAIACYVLVVRGIDKSGKEVLLLDTNHDKSFANESPINIGNYQSDKDFENQVGKSIQVSYETFFKNKIVSRAIPLLILKSHEQYFYSFPQYAVTELKQKACTTQIAVSHEFRFPNYMIANVALLTKQKTSKDSVARKTQYLYIGSHMFKNKGVDFATLSLLLEETNAPVSSLQGGQKGMLAIPFSGKNVIDTDEIALNDFKGKYLFIDFWGSWCSPCVAQLKALSTIYANVDRAKVAFLGIAGRDDIDKLRKMILEKNILWPNILSDRSNLIVEKYHIMQYPTGILIDPSGKVIETDVSSYNLEMLLKKYLDN